MRGSELAATCPQCAQRGQTIVVRAMAVGIAPARAGAKGVFSELRRSASPLPMTVAPLSSSARDYVRAFDLTSIALWRDGRLGVSRNPTGAERAWWCPAKAAGKIVRAANANGRDVAAGAARFLPSEQVTLPLSEIRRLRVLGLWVDPNAIALAGGPQAVRDISESYKRLLLGSR
jgi:hypothetical protein